MIIVNPSPQVPDRSRYFNRLRNRLRVWPWNHYLLFRTRNLSAPCGIGVLSLVSLVAALALLSAPHWALAQSHSPKKASLPREWKYQANPFAGDEKTIHEGLNLYRRRCKICHGNRGGRGPNLFATQLAGHEFLRAVMEGRDGTQMPAWEDKLSEEQVWKIMAYIIAARS